MTSHAATPNFVSGGDPKPKESRSAAVRGLFRSFKFLALLFVIYYLVLPQIAGARKSVRTLGEVNVWLILVGIALESAALLMYSFLTRAALPRDAISHGTLFRVQLATKAIGNIMPGGSAASTALGFRLITLAGVTSADAGFALAAAGISSAVMLNLLLWATLLISIPISGAQPIYVTVALIGVFVMLLFGGVVFGLLRGQARAERLARGLAAKITFLNEDRAAEVVTRLADRLRELLAARELLRVVVLWSAMNWLLDAASLWVFLRAFGGTLRIDGLLVSFCVANVFSVLPITPGGLGIVEALYPFLLAFFGLPLEVIALGVGTYRLAQYWMPIPVGGLVYVSLRLGPWRIDRQGERLGSLRSEATSSASSGASEPVYGPHEPSQRSVAKSQEDH